MAFMPEDVLNKNFIATQFRRGYDEHEVDDFLDEVVVELRRLSGENDDLRAQLKACQESKGTRGAAGVCRQRSGRGSARSRSGLDGCRPARRPGQDRDLHCGCRGRPRSMSAARIAKAKAAAEQAEAQAAERTKAARDAKEAREATDQSTTSSASVSAPTGDEVPVVAEVANAAAAASASAAGVLALAQKLHDQYVSEGQNTRERLITEGQALHDQLSARSRRRRKSFCRPLRPGTTRSSPKQRRGTSR